MRNVYVFIFVIVFLFSLSVARNETTKYSPTNLALMPTTNVSNGKFLLDVLGLELRLPLKVEALREVRCEVIFLRIGWGENLKGPHSLGIKFSFPKFVDDFRAALSTNLAYIRFPYEHLFSDSIRMEEDTGDVYIWNLGGVLSYEFMNSSNNSGADRSRRYRNIRPDISIFSNLAIGFGIPFAGNLKKDGKFSPALKNIFPPPFYISAGLYSDLYIWRLTFDLCFQIMIINGKKLTYFGVAPSGALGINLSDKLCFYINGGLYGTPKQWLGDTDETEFGDEFLPQLEIGFQRGF